MLLTPERLYLEVGRLIAEMPELASGAITSKMQRWLVTATEVLRSSGSLKEALQLTTACENLDGPLRAATLKAPQTRLNGHHFYCGSQYSI